jgi:hypothetical protein
VTNRTSNSFVVNPLGDWWLSIAKLHQIPCPFLERLPLLIDVPVYIVGGLDSFAGVDKNTLADICLDAKLGEPRPPCATQVAPTSLFD